MHDQENRTPNWQAGRAAGLTALDDFMPRVADYGRLRNFDFGPEERSNISCLSPYLKYRLITEQEVCHAVLARYSFDAVEKFIQEVCWRTYWKGWLQMRPSVWADYKAERDGFIAQLEKDGAMRAHYNQAIEGQTGIDCFDAWANELKTHGYLHNHARMWFASIWIFTLKLPWALGADFFLRHLLDGDAASNTLSWRWVAGLQTVGKNYVARAENIEKFTNGRFRPKGLVDNAAPLSTAHISPIPMDPFWRFEEENPPIDAEKTLFVVHEDDCSIDVNKPAKHIVVLDASQNISPLDISQKRIGFAHGALLDGISVECTHVLSSEAIVAYAAQNGLQHIVLSQPCVGPVLDVLANLPVLAKENGLSIGVRTHEWDRVAWPKATKGFFAFKKSIPALLALNLPQRG